MDFKDLQKEYGNKFIAILNEDKVVASGKTFNEVVAKLNSIKIINKSGLSIRFIRQVVPKFGVVNHESSKEGGSEISAGHSEQTSGNSSTGKEAGGLSI